MINKELFLRITLSLFLIAFVILLTACSKTPEPKPTDEPVVTGNTVQFPNNPQTARRLLTTAAVDAHENILSLPAWFV